jgi:hypothetical protein
MSSGDELTGGAAVASTVSVTRLLDITKAAARPDQPQALCRAVGTLVGEIVGHRLYSISVFMPASRELERIYSSDEHTSPVGGRKLKQGTEWAESVLDQGETFLGPGRAEIRGAFDDHEKIFALGLGSIINVPLRWAGATVGTMNLVDREHRYGPEHARAATSLGQFLLPVFLAQIRQAPVNNPQSPTN